MSDHRTLADLFRRHHETLEQRIGEVIEAALRPIRQQLTELLAENRPELAALDQIKKQLADIIESLAEPPESQATRLAFEIPTRTRKGIPVPNFELPNDEILTVTIKATNSAGVFEPIPTGDTFTVVSSDPASLNAVMGTDASGNQAVLVNALVQHASNVTVTVTDSAGLTAATQIFDVVDDVTATALALDLTTATHTPQPVPAA